VSGKRPQTQLRGGWLAAKAWLPPLLLLLAYALLVSSALRHSATVDEQSHLFRGAAFLREGAGHFLLGHPLGASALSALPLLTEPDLRLPLDHPAWAAGDWAVAGGVFLWQINDHPLRLIFLGRLPVIWLTLLLGALLWRWGRELAGPEAGLLAMALVLFDPNMIAHGRLITGDGPLTFFFLLTCYGYWRYAVGRGSIGGAILLTGLGLGLAGASKFNAALLPPILGLAAAVLAAQRRSWRPLAVLAGAGIVGWAVIWAAHGFALRPLPGGPFWADLFWQWQYLGGQHGVYLAGNYSTEGWLYYFPVAFLVKTPLIALVLYGWALATAVSLIKQRWTGWRAALSHPYSLLLVYPPLIYFTAVFQGSLNIGYRYLLPMLPFFALLTAVALQNWTQINADKRRFIRPSSIVHRLSSAISRPTNLIFLPLAVSLLAWPNYISYFNALTLGQGWRILSDSNVDWGQDLPALAEWQRRDGRRLNLSYFGAAYPSAYGLAFDPLPTWAPGPEQMEPLRQPYYPPNPAPGVYAISVTNLHGVVLGAGRDDYAWFRDKEPIARAGGGIFIYEVAPRGQPVDLFLGGLPLAAIPPDDFARLETNQPRLRWFDPAQAVMMGPTAVNWLALGEGTAVDPALRPLLDNLIDEAWPPGRLRPIPPAALTALDAFTADWQKDERLFTQEAGRVKLSASQLTAVTEDEIALLTLWRQTASPAPVKIFIHLLDEREEIVAQWDGLGAAWEGWRAGDWLVHGHRLTLPPNLPPGDYALWIGLYHPEDGRRWLTDLGTDRYLLTTIRR
jgi:hypothetical protein